ncbi:MAG: murein biosynthesis integral membrane protein MurJ, partial [Syntrophomonadaceae bacterium]|nr:murein biosynthesis integral membrane protein MurJ [Syntrophomonadaceae bacterium]HAA09194.1 murein biosynthesis integral membrane protein MurJ [Syntrophomonas sp.]
MTYSGKHMARAAFLLMVTVILSRVLGYGREVALYTLFGQNYITDAYRAAFSIPDLIYMLLVGGALSS